MAASPIRANVRKLLAVAASQAGVSESPPYSNRTPYTAWYGLVGPWCAMFVSWCFAEAGRRLPAIRTSKGFAYCPDGVNYAKRNGIWHPPTVRPLPGWMVLFDFPGDGVDRPSHVGLVLEVLPDGRLSTWEGNTSSGGGRDGGSVVNHYRRVSGGIIGYVQVDDVVPAAPTGVIMQAGDAGDAVRFWQAILNVLAGYRINSQGRRGGRRIVEDGEFGPQTVEATRELQRFANQFVTYIGMPERKVSVDGRVTRRLADTAAEWVKVAQRRQV